jgi:hypothetical protein
MDNPDESISAREAFREFALACRAERDRLALLRMAREDERFDNSLADRAVAEFFATRIISAAKA